MGDTKYITQLAEQAGSTATNSVVGAAMGMILGGYNDRRQLKQQERLQNLQMKGNKEMTDYEYMKQLQMWKDTGYGPQVEQMKQAGINPGLMYGMGGGGGQTAGHGGSGVTGGQAPTGGREIQDVMGMGIQSALLRAQRENIEAQTENIKADTANKPLTGKNIEASTASLSQGIENQKAAQKYTEAQTTMQEIQNDIQGSEINDIKAAIKYGMRKLYAEMRSSEITQNIDQATQNTKIRQAQATLANTVIDSWLKQAQAKGIAQNIIESVNRVKNDIQENMRQWDKMSQTNKQIDLQDQMVHYNTSIPPELKEILDNILIIPGRK